MNESSGDASRDCPGVIVLPPVLSLATLLIGLLLHFMLKWHLFPAAPLWTRIAGGAAIVSAILLMIWGRTTMVQAGTNVPPNKPTLVIVTRGPFRFTRNPLYVGNLTIYLGLTTSLPRPS